MQNIQIKVGYLLYTDNKYDICYLISSDTDLIPAIQAAQKKVRKLCMWDLKIKLA